MDSGALPQTWQAPNLDPEQLILVVVGAHPKAEAGDRPIAQWVCDKMRAWLDARFSADGGPPCTVLIVTDVWYLNDRDLAECPVVSIGGPGVNALSAALGGRIPSVFVVDNVFVVQLDPEFDELRACCWGMGTAQTAAAAGVFVDRYLDGFMESATARWA